MNKSFRNNRAVTQYIRGSGFESNERIGAIYVDQRYESLTRGQLHLKIQRKC